MRLLHQVPRRPRTETGEGTIRRAGTLSASPDRHDRALLPYYDGSTSTNATAFALLLDPLVDTSLIVAAWWVARRHEGPGDARCASSRNGCPRASLITPAARGVRHRRAHYDPAQPLHHALLEGIQSFRAPTEGEEPPDQPDSALTLKSSTRPTPLSRRRPIRDTSTASAPRASSKAPETTVVPGRANSVIRAETLADRPK